MDKHTLIVESKAQGVKQTAAELDKLGKSAEKTEKATDKLGSTSKKTATALITKLNAGASKVADFFSGKGSSATSKFIGGLSNLVKTIGGVKTAMIVMIAVGIIAFFNQTTLAAEQFNAELANTATLIPGNTQRIQELGTGIQSMAMKYGSAMADLNKATYQVISAFPELEGNVQVLDTLDVAARAAKAGVASTADAVNLLSAVSKGYGDTSSDMLNTISDLAFTTVKLGQTTFPELASSIGQAVPLAKSLGVSMQELFAAEATLTGVTGNAAEVTTQLRSIFTSLVTPTTEMKKLMDEMGAKSGKEFIEKAGGMGEVLNLVRSTSEKSGKELATYFGRVEAVTSALALSGAQTETYIQRLEDMNTATRATDTALKEITEGVNEYGFTLEQNRQKFEVLKVSIGNLFLPLKATLMEILGTAAKVIASLLNQINALPAPIKSLTAAFVTITAAVKLLGLALGTAFGPAGIAITAVSTILFTFKDDIFKTTSVVDDLNEASETLVGLFDEQDEITQNLTTSTDDLTTAEQELLKAQKGLNDEMIVSQVAKVSETYDAIIGKARDLGETNADLSETFDLITQSMNDMDFDTFKNTTPHVMDLAKELKKMSRNLDEDGKRAVQEVSDQLYDLAALPYHLQDSFNQYNTEAIASLRNTMAEARGVVENEIDKLTGPAENTAQMVAERIVADTLDPTKLFVSGFETEFEKLVMQLVDQLKQTSATVNSAADDAVSDELTKDQEFVQKMADDLEQSFFEIDQRAAIYGDSIDVMKERSEALSKILDTMFSEKFNADGSGVQYIIDQFKKLGGVMGEVSETSGPMSQGKYYEQFSQSYRDALETMLSGEQTIDRNAEVMDQLGWEYDATAKKAELFQSTFENLLNSNATNEEILNFVRTFKDLNTSLDKTPTFLDRVKDKMADLFDLTGEEAAALSEAIDGIADGLAQVAQQQYLDFFNDIGGSLADGSLSMRDWADAIGGVAKAILDALPNLFLQAGLTMIAAGQWPLGLALMAASASASVVSGYVDEKASESAKGNVFSGGELIPFARGGVFSDYLNSLVSAPTVVPMAGGSALFGEQGTEAVIPLTRTSDGSLGVRAKGGESPQVNVVIINNSGEQVETAETEHADGSREIQVLIGQVVSRQISQGLYDKPMVGRYKVKAQGY